MTYAGISDSDKPSGDGDAKIAIKEDDHSSNAEVRVKLGDFIRWTTNGVDQFDARRVEWVSPDGSHLRVFGSPTGIPMSEATVVRAPHMSTTPAPVIDAGAGSGGSSTPNISVYQTGGRLQITADVDAVGIEKLETILAKYKEILKLMN